MPTELDYGDVHAITNLLHLSLQHMDNNDPSAFAALFIADGVVDITKLGIRKQGTEALSGLCSGLAAKFARHQHWEGNVVIQGSDSGATNTSYWKAIFEGRIVSLGRHEDTFVKADGGGWKFSERKIIHAWNEAKGYFDDEAAASEASAESASEVGSKKQRTE